MRRLWHRRKASRTTPTSGKQEVEKVACTIATGAPACCVFTVGFDRFALAGDDIVFVNHKDDVAPHVLVLCDDFHADEAFFGVVFFILGSHHSVGMVGM